MFLNIGHFRGMTDDFRMVTFDSEKITYPIEAVNCMIGVYISDDDFKEVDTRQVTIGSTIEQLAIHKAFIFVSRSRYTKWSSLNMPQYSIYSNDTYDVSCLYFGPGDETNLRKWMGIYSLNSSVNLFNLCDDSAVLLKRIDFYIEYVTSPFHTPIF